MKYMAGIPVGAHSNTLGLSGSFPCTRRFFSTQRLITLVIEDFPEPVMRLENEFQILTNHFKNESLPAPPWMISLGASG